MQPLFYAALAAAAGIAVAAWPARIGAAATPPPMWIWLLAAALVAASLALAQTKHWRAAASAGLALCFALGFGRARWVLAHPARPGALAQAIARMQPGPRDRIWITGYLRDTPELLMQNRHASAVRLDLEATSAAKSEDAEPYRVTGGVRLYAYPPEASGTAFGASAPPPANDSWARPVLALQAGAGLGASVHLRPLPQYRDPGVTDYTATTRREGIGFSATLDLTLASRWRLWSQRDAPRATVLRARLWSWLSARLDALAPPAQAPRVNALLRGMLLGDTARLDEATRSAFQADGAYHLLVVAGLHIGVLAWLLWWAFRRLRVPATAAGMATLALLGAYAWVIAGRTPTQRALFMLALYMLARWWYRERQALNAVGAAGLALLAWHPLDLFQPGWQMSLGAATLLAGVALPLAERGTRPLARAFRRLDDIEADAAFAPRLAQLRLDLRDLEARLRRAFPRLGAALARAVPWAARTAIWVGEIAAISLILQLGFAAFNAVYMHRASPWSVLANAMLVPMAGVLIPMAWLAAILPLPARVAGTALIGVGRAMLGIAAGMARWPLANLRVPSPPAWMLCVFAAASAAWIWACVRAEPKRAMVAAFGAMAALAAALAWAPFPVRLPPGLTATVLDVGQGDSIFVSFPDGRTLLVDGGPRSAHWDTGGEIVAPFLWSLGLHRIDAVLLTHGHNDHLGGLATVVAQFRPEEVWLTRTLPTEPAMRAFERQIAAEGAKVRRLAAGDIFRAGDARITVLLPPPDYMGGAQASNDDSMAVRVSMGGNAMLLEGDAQTPGEKWMVAHQADRGLELYSPMLKVGHHGSNTSSTAAFLAAVRPKVAVISLGAGNEYGFPAKPVLERLRAAGVKVFRTDLDGAVQVRLRQGALEVYLFPRLPGDR